MKAENFLILGNDKRMTACCNRINDLSYEACMMDNIDSVHTDRFKYIVLPLPSVVNGNIFGTKIRLDSFIYMLHSENVVIYGNIQGQPFADKGISYYYNDDFMFKNSYLTAQGVLRIILQNIEQELTSLNVAVIGYGRCGRAICMLLQKLGLNVTLISKNPESQIVASCLGFKSADASVLLRESEGYDIIINTVPVNIISCLFLESLSEDTIYVEVASKPYGFDIETMINYDFKYILADNLPGRFTPEAAGKNIADTVIEILKEGKYG